MRRVLVQAPQEELDLYELCRFWDEERLKTFDTSRSDVNVSKVFQLGDLIAKVMA